jgi:hypothetical protein
VLVPVSATEFLALRGPHFNCNLASQGVTAGIQSIAVVICLLVGGWWTLKTFVFQNPAYYGLAQKYIFVGSASH